METKKLNTIAADLVTIAGLVTEVAQQILAMSNGDLMPRVKPSRRKVQNVKPASVAEAESEDKPLPTAEEFYADLVEIKDPSGGTYRVPRGCMNRIKVRSHKTQKADDPLTFQELSKRKVVPNRPLPRVLTPQRLLLGRLQRNLTQKKFAQITGIADLYAFEIGRHPHKFAEHEPAILEVFRKIDEGKLRIRRSRSVMGRLVSPRGADRNKNGS